MGGDVPATDQDELTRLRARVAELERASSARDAPAGADGRIEFQGALYEAMVYGLGRTLSLYDPRSVDILVREMGRRIREYLEGELGYHIGTAQTYPEFVKKVTAFFVGHGFVNLELVGWESDQLHARWHNLLGLRAYERLVAAGGEVFISCPLNAVLHDGLAAFGKELQLRRKEFDFGQRSVESWEEIVDKPGPEPEPRRLSLDPERVLELEREQGRQVRMRDEFIRIASHELATPLTSTKLALRRLEGIALPETAERSVAVLKRQVRRLEQLVTEMLDATRLQTSRLQLERAPADLVLIVRQVIDLLQPEDRVGDAQIRLTSVPSLVGRWDAARLDQVVTNLVSNAIKYGAGSPIDVEVAAADGRARLTVHDRGIGIPPAAIDRIFNAFERAVPVEAYAGLGLGLYIARKFVEMHNGSISARSDAGGTTFTIDLPLDSERRDGLFVAALPVDPRRVP